MRAGTCGLAVGLLVLGLIGGWFLVIRMPGKSYQGALPPATDEVVALKRELYAHVQMLGRQIGERNLSQYDNLLLAAEYIHGEFTVAGYEVRRQSFDVFGKNCENIEVEIRGTSQPDDIMVIGAHYDSVQGSPGANDNASGVAAVLALAKIFARSPASRTLRFVAFANEEPPYFQTSYMGSWIYARRSRERKEHIHLMLSLETIGYYSEKSASQRYPSPLGLFYPSTGNFIGIVGNTQNGTWVRKVVGSFRTQVPFPSEGSAMWGGLPGIEWSDHWAFWEEGFPAIMITDTALFRDPYYHTANDTPDHIHYEHFARVTAGLYKVIEDIANEPSSPAL